MNVSFHYRLAILLVCMVMLAACGGRDEPEPAADTAADTAVESVSEGAEEAAEPEMVGDAEAGKALFATTCAACHGPAGEGVPGLGKDMTQSEFIAEKSDAELLEFLHEGRSPTDPLNTTGVLMPPKGGNPALTDEQLMDIIAYVRELHE